MFDRFQVCLAYYFFAAEWHKGQWSPEYKILGRLNNLRFSPGAGATKSSLDEYGRWVLAKLIRRARRGETVGR
jgi:hypothetical protein